ncbi:transposase [Escherichia coli]|nr:transposase [Escherichia coli]
MSTSQRCTRCGHTAKENRVSQSQFECLACGYTARYSTVLATF